MNERVLVAKWRVRAKWRVDYATPNAVDKEAHRVYTVCADELEALLNSRVGGEAEEAARYFDAMLRGLAPEERDCPAANHYRLAALALRGGEHKVGEFGQSVLEAAADAVIAANPEFAPSPGGVDNDGYGLRGAFREGYLLGTRGSFDKETYGSEEAAWANSETGKTTLRPTPPEVTDGIGYDIDYEGIVSLWRQNADGTRNLLVLTPQASADFTAALAGGK